MAVRATTIPLRLLPRLLRVTPGRDRTGQDGTGSNWSPSLAAKTVLRPSTGALRVVRGSPRPWSLRAGSTTQGVILRCRSRNAHGSVSAHLSSQTEGRRSHECGRGPAQPTGGTVAGPVGVRHGPGRAAEGSG